MPIIATNKKLNQILHTSSNLRAMASHCKLPEIIDSAVLLHAEDCYFIESLYQKRGNATRVLLGDDTGYECYVNHIHLDDYNGDEQLMMAFCICATIEEKWLNSAFRALTLRQIISYDNDSCVYRFHVVRNGQSWLAPNLSSYQEMIMVIDSDSSG